MKFSICSFLTVFGQFFFLVPVELSHADCSKDSEVSVVEHAVQPRGVERAETNRVDVAKTETDRLQKTPVKLPELGLEQLVERLKKTEAIGFFTKLAIRSDVLDFQQSVESYRKKKTFNEHTKILRDRFNGLLLKILALLDRDPVLSRDIHRARDSIWISLVEVKS